MFTQLPANATAPVTGSTSFACQASGDPAATISWYRNQTLITGEDCTVYTSVALVVNGEVRPST